MAWYAAHVIMYMRFKDGNQDRYPVYENIYLFQTESAEEAQNLQSRPAGKVRVIPAEA
ncbi:MAG: hypothetical protein ABSH09_20100 [Bryobacteraceae bacterium]|jgi:hypothetical protein